MAVTTNLGLTLLGADRRQPEVIVDANMQLLDAQSTVKGTAFPGTPATNTRFFRTDRNIEYFYNGTRWLSTTVYSDIFSKGDQGPLPYAATVASGAERLSAPWSGVYDLWLEHFQFVFLISGGTALSASHKWVTLLTKIIGGTPTTLATITIDSGALDVFRVTTGTINALLGTTAFAFAIGHTKTGTPGTLYSLPRIVYRLVG